MMLWGVCSHHQLPEGRLSLLAMPVRSINLFSER